MSKAKTTSSAAATMVGRSEDAGVARADAGAAPETAAQLVHEIALEQLVARANNPRRTLHESDLAELAASIREHGIQVPLQVRPRRFVAVTFEDGSSESMGPASREECSELLLRPGVVETDVEDIYEIVAGHRRSRAAALAGLSFVPCIVREMTDEQAAEIALIDNLQRVDVPAMEEAEAFGELLDRLLSVQAVALKVGKEQSYIAQRLKLLTLSEHARTALAEQMITIDHALLLARLGPAEQDKELRWCLNQYSANTPTADVIQMVRTEQGAAHVYAWEPQSVVRLKNHIASDGGIRLSKAPWPMEEDYLLPDAGSCLDCPKNTSANAPLFGDLNMAEPTCTDGACFKAKVEGFVRLQVSAATTRQSEFAEGPAIRVSWKANNKKPRMASEKATGATADGSGVNLLQTFGLGQWVEAKAKSCPSVRLGVAVDAKNEANNGRSYSTADEAHKTGEILHVCVAAGCKPHPKQWEKEAALAESAAAKAAPGSKAKTADPAAAAKRTAEIRAWVEAEPAVRRALLDAIAARATVDQVLRLAVSELTGPIDVLEALGDKTKVNWNDAEKLAREKLAKVSGKPLLQLFLKVKYVDDLMADEYDFTKPTKGRDALRRGAEDVGVDWKAVEAKFGAAQAEKKPSENKPAKTAKPANRAVPEPPAKKAVLSPEARKRIAEAQKKRWKKAAKKGGGR